jgi:hypothetical protein
MRFQTLFTGITTLCLFAFLQQAGAQSSGLIIRQASLPASRTILDPIAPFGYTSKTTTGFGTDDVGNAKIPFKPIPTFSNEPFGDLRRGPSHQFSDFVPDANGAGVYLHFDGTNLLFRMRLGSLVPGAKGYSILIDADGRFGASGPNADPDYQPATTGVNGNPGFEIEVDLFTQNASNPGVAVYNVNGTSSPGGPVATYNDWLAYSQASIAGTADNGDPDYFIDFYVPFSALQLAFPSLTTSTPLRFSATTVMAPQPAIGGPKSDIYGLNDNLYPDPNVEYETIINTLPPVPLNGLSGPNPVYPVTMCTKPPVITTNALTAGTVTVSGNWSRAALTGTEQVAATIRIYRIASGTTTVTLAATVSGTITSGTGWTSPSFTAAAGDIIFATAQGAGESECLRSNTLQAPLACNSTNTPPAPIIPVCVGGASNGTFTKGFSGTNYPAGATIYLENVSSGVIENSASPVSNNPFAITGNSFTYSSGCNGGANLGGGSYRVYYQTAAGCRSEPFYFCLPGNGPNGISSVPTATPVITSALTPGTTRVGGTGEAGAKVWLYVNGVMDPQSPLTIASNGAFLFVGLNLQQGHTVYVRSVFTSATMSQNKCGTSSSVGTVNCYTAPPVITDTTSTGALQLNVPISGVSREPVGTDIKVYEVNTAVTPNTYTLVASTKVGTGGVWSTSGANGTILASTNTVGTFNAAASKTYSATAQNGTCTLSRYSGNLTTGSGITTGRCGAITATTPATSPLSITTSTTALSGTLGGTAAAGTIVRIYEDGALVASSAATGTLSWGPVDVAGRLYSGDGIRTGRITIGIQEGTKEEASCPAIYTVSCTGVTPPTFTFTSCSSGCNESTVQEGNTLTYTVTGATVGDFYALRDSATGRSLSAGVWAGSSTFTLTTIPLQTRGSYKIQLVATRISGTEACSAASQPRQYTILPVNLLSFRGSRSGGVNLLTWQTGEERRADHFVIERSTDGARFATIGQLQVRGSGSAYSFPDAEGARFQAYYRLRIVDIDGKTAYSPVVLIRESGATLVLNAVWPSPFTTQLNVSFQLSQPGPVELQLIDAAGRTVAVRRARAGAGPGELSLVSLDRLPEGLYVLRLLTAGQLLEQKLIKKR